MLPESPFLQTTYHRVDRALARIGEMIWSPVEELPISFGGARPDFIGCEEAERLEYSPIKLPFHWGKLFDQGWFRIELPVSRRAADLYLHWIDQGEATVYVEGKPFYGFDVAHRHCQLPPGTSEIYLESLCLQSAIWHPNATGLDREGSKLTAAGLYRRNDLAWDAWHDLRVLRELAMEEAQASAPLDLPKISNSCRQPSMTEASVWLRRLLRGLDDAVNAFDVGGLAPLKEATKTLYSSLEGHHDPLRAVLTGHAHIDLVWLWPQRAGEYKAVHTFANMNRMMDLYPEFIFGYSQPASYDAVERLSPRLAEDVQERIRSQRWEALGATDVESDTLIPCGEALARSFLIGQKRFRHLQGQPSRVLWLPDVFGYSGCLPQIMVQTGVEYFFTTKLAWSDVITFPYSSFLWRGSDGSEVVVHLAELGYNQLVCPDELKRGARVHRQSDIHEEFLAPSGHGDGGGGVTEEMCERARRMASLPGLPAAGWGRIDDFFDRLNEVRSRLPAWQGELYLGAHRGIYTTHGNLKAQFRASERAMQIWEAVRCATGGNEVDEAAWRDVVFAQFHDYIPGSAAWEIYEEGLPKLAEGEAYAWESAKRDLSEEASTTPALFNPLPMERTVIAEGRPLRLAPLSGAPVTDLEVVERWTPPQVESMGMTSDFVAVRFDARGQITRLAFGDREVPILSPLAQLVLYPDYPIQHDAWDLDRHTLTLGQPATADAEIIDAHAEAFDAQMTFQRTLGQKSDIKIRYSVSAIEPVLRIEYDINWQESETLMRALFPTAYAGRMARFGAPFGSVLRGQMPGLAYDEAMFESPASRWATVADDGEGEGLALIAEAKYGFSCRDGTLGVSLLRSPVVTGMGGQYGQLFPPGIRRGKPRPTHSDQGRHLIRMALSFHSSSGSRECLAPALADLLFTPPLSYAGGAISDSGYLGMEGGDSLVPSWAKPAADGNGWILRLHETMGHRGTARILIKDGWKCVPTDLSEAVSNQKASTLVAFTPYQLVSLRIHLIAMAHL